MMKVVVINGNTRHGSTWNCKQLFLQELARYAQPDVTEYSLPRDMPHFCHGCFACFYKGEDTCPHVSSVGPIVQSILTADLIILTSPVYAMDVSGQMKALLDHLCFMWLSHRPNPEMFDKIGLVITTTAGAGLGRTAKTLLESLRFLGLKRVFVAKYKVSAMKWDEVSEQKKTAIARQSARLASQVARAVERRQQLPATLFHRFMFFVMRSVMQKNTWNPLDRQHWEAQGWIDAKSIST